MRDFPTYRKAARKYWERRRIAYNLALVLPALIGYSIADSKDWAAEPHVRHYPYIIVWLVTYALGANLCYSSVYALEFLFGTDEPASRWISYRRATIWFLGVAISLMLALAGGMRIAHMEWGAQIHPRN